ncbi:hypothetical protein [Mycobacterium sp. ACS1612]|uniref:hypothetical protein n=1 Tax=Mycobacterium sp. ACS1612 TaxID=1834117 RepID=UPI000B046670|nr:hypothetical protein [Mycobacterium sp. ACS1612]
MNTKRETTSRRGVKLVGAACAAAAVIGAGVLTVVIDNAESGNVATLAGSGDGSSAGVYSQPTVAGMNMGATATFTTPATVEPTTEAVPPVKAGS